MPATKWKHELARSDRLAQLLFCHGAANRVPASNVPARHSASPVVRNGGQVTSIHTDCRARPATTDENSSLEARLPSSQEALQI